MATFSSHRNMTAPAAVVWDVITDHALYGEVAPNLATVEVVDGTDEDLVRRCVDTDGNAWTESCTWWARGEGFAVAVDVPNSDFHRRLFTRFEGEWRLDESADGVTVTVAFAFEPRYGPVGRLITWYFASRAPGIVETIFDRWETAVEARQDSPGQVAGQTTGDRVDRPTNALFR